MRKMLERLCGDDPRLLGMFRRVFYLLSIKWIGEYVSQDILSESNYFSRGKKKELLFKVPSMQGNLNK